MKLLNKIISLLLVIVVTATVITNTPHIRGEEDVPVTNIEEVIEASEPPINAIEGENSEALNGVESGLTEEGTIALTEVINAPESTSEILEPASDNNLESDNNLDNVAETSPDEIMALESGEINEVQSIVINSQPTKISYVEGETFDATGMSVLVTYVDGATAVINSTEFATNEITFSPNGALSLADNGKPVTVALDGKTATTNNLIVTAVPVMSANIYVKYSQDIITSSSLNIPVPYDFNIDLSAQDPSTVLSNPYMEVYLDKKLFNKPSTNDVKVSAGSVVSSISITENTNEYVIRLNITQLVGGMALAFPANLTLKNKSLAHEEPFTINTKLFNKEGTVISDSKNSLDNDNLIAKTAFTIPVSNGTTTFYVGDSQVDSTKTHLSNDYVDTFQFYVKNVISETNNNANNNEIDKRDTRITATLEADMVFDPTLPNNQGWTYDAATHTVYKDFSLVSSQSNTDNLGIKLNNRALNSSKQTTTKITFTSAFVNVDEHGNKTLDTSRSKSALINHVITYVPTIISANVRKSISPWQYLFDETTSTREFIWNVSIGFYPSTQPPAGTTGTFKSLEDRTAYGAVYKQYKYYYYQPNLTPEDIVKLGNNKLYGINADGSKVLIAENIKPADSLNNASFVDIPNGNYKSIKLELDEEINLKYNSAYSVFFTVNTLLSDAEYASLKTFFDNPANSSNSKNMFNYATVSGSGGTSAYSDWFSLKLEYAKMDSATIALNGVSNNLSTLVDTKIDARSSFRINYALAKPRQFVNPKLIVLLPSGVKYEKTTLLPTNDSVSISSDYQTISNYKGTGKIAYIYDIVLKDLQVTPPGGTMYSFYNFSTVFYTTKETIPSTNPVEVIMSWDNDSLPKPNPIIGYNADKYDANNDGQTAPFLGYTLSNFLYTPPKELIVSKKSKYYSSPELEYGSITNVDGTTVADYCIDIFNNTDFPQSNFTLIDVLPYPNDLSIVPSSSGAYSARGSTFHPTLAGPLTPKAGYTYLYSMDTPKSKIEDNNNATWLSEGDVTDFSKVTMIKVILNSGYSIPKKTTDKIYFKVNIPDTTKLNDGDKAVNSVAIYFGNTLSTAIEALSNTLLFTEYTISGKVYYDRNKDSLFDSNDLAIKNRKVNLYKVDGGVETLVATVNSDANGNYTFKDKINIRGLYRVKVDLIGDDTVTSINNSTTTIIGSDINSTAIKEINLTPNSPKYLINAGLINVIGDVVVKFQDENGKALASDVVTSGVKGDSYTSTPANVTNYVVKTTPDNASGTYTEGTQTVVYIYKRANAGNVTVNYVDEAGNVLATQVVLDGTDKLGLPYTTAAEEIENFELLATPTNSTGSYTATAQTVNYVYRRKDAGNVTVNYVDESGKAINPPITLSGYNKMGLPYESELLSINGYIIKTVPTNASGLFILEEQYVTYIYKKIINPSISNSEGPTQGRTCQDDGYPAGYYWSDDKQACVIDVNYKVPSTAEKTTMIIYISLGLLSLLGLYLLKKKK